MIWLALIPAVPVTFLLWAYLHEEAHVIALQRFRPNATVTHHLYPHRHNDRFYWARVSWIAVGPPLKNQEQGWVSIAPRFVDVLGVVAAPLCAHYLPGWAAVVCAVLFSGGIIDLAVGSIGKHPRSDLRRVASSWGWSATTMRVVGWFVVGTSGLTTLLAFT